MPLFVVSSPSGRQVIVNASSSQEAVATGNQFVGGPAQARPATFADAQTIPLLGSVIRGDNRPAQQTDPGFLVQMGLGSQELAGQLGFGGQVGGGPGFITSSGQSIPSGGPTTPGPGALPEESYPTGSFLRGLRGAGAPTEGIFGNYLRSRQPAAESTYLAQRALSGAGVPGIRQDEASPFQDYVQQQGGQFGGQAQDAFQRLLALGRGGTEPTDAYAKRFVNPSTSQDLNRVYQLAYQTARNRLGGFAANELLPDAARSQEDFAMSNQAQGGNFLDYLNRTWRLGY